MSDKSEACIVRPATSLQEAHDIYWPLMGELGWNRSIADSKTHYISTGPSAFLLLFPADTSDPPAITTTSSPHGLVVPFIFANNTAWIGFFCIQSPSRGRGWGRALFRAALDHFSARGVTVVGLDAVPEQVGTYSRRGFVPMDRVTLMRRPSLGELPLEQGLAHVGPGKEIVDIEHVPERMLVASDLGITGLERERLWSQEALLDRPDVFGFVMVKAGSEPPTSELEGWVIVRGCEDGFRVGPLYGTSAAVARALLVTAMKRVEDRAGRLNAEVWMGNGAAAEMFRELGWTESEVMYHRMWLGGRRPAAQGPGGKAEREMWAIFDAGEG